MIKRSICHDMNGRRRNFPILIFKKEKDSLINTHFKYDILENASLQGIQQYDYNKVFIYISQTIKKSKNGLFYSGESKNNYNSF